jgi:tetrahydromethanopterin S-methyltransferase subunit D
MTNLALTSTIEGCHDPELSQIYQNITGSLLHDRL